MNERTATPRQEGSTLGKAIETLDYTRAEIEQALSWLDEREGVLP
jgi:hypothetical protein